MPVIAYAVAACACGLLLGFGAHHATADLIAVCAAVLAMLSRVPATRAIAFSIAALDMGGDLMAAARVQRDAACLRTIVTHDTVRVRLLADAAPGGAVRAETAGGHCAISVRAVLHSGHAPYGAEALLAAGAVATPDGLFLRGADLFVVRGPSILARLRRHAAQAIQRDFGADAPLAKALLIADMSELGPEIRARFAAAGLVHILSISGLHVTIVAAAMLLLLEAARLPRRRALVAGCVLTAGYVALIGAPPPAVRAAVMFGCSAFSRIAQRPTSPWAPLAVGSAWPIALDTRVVNDVGWQLTVAGMAALIVAGDINTRYVADRLSGWRKRLAGEVTTGVIATIVTAPLVTWYFGRLSMVAPLANIAANPVAAILQPTLFLALALGWWPAASGLVADAARPALHALDGVAGVAARMPGAGTSIAPTLAGAFLAAIAIVALMVMLRSRRPVRTALVGLGALAGIAWRPVLTTGSGELEMHAIDVGQADAIALRTPKGRWILVDAGGAWSGGDAGRRVVMPYLERYGGDVALFVLTHPHLDHVGGAATVIQALHPGAYWDGAFLSANEAYRASLRAAEAAHVPWQRVHPGDSLNVDGVRVLALAPDSVWTSGQEDPNNTSAMLMVEFGSVRFLLTGDAEAPEEAWVESRWGGELHADVLKAGHHGSKTSSTPSFLDAVHPRVAVVSVGAGNTYGLPSRPVMDAYAARGIVTLRTDEVGTVVVTTDGTHVRIRGGEGVWNVPP